LLLIKYYSGDQMKKNEMGAACSTYGGQERSVYGVLVGRPEGKRPLGRPRHRWDDNIKIGFFRECGGRAWSGFIWLRIGTGECGNELAGCIKCREFLE